MNEVEKKEIEKMAKAIYETKDCLEEIDYRYGLFDNDDHFHRIARKLTIAGYGKVEDYKKEIERLKELIIKIKEMIDKNFYYDDVTTSGELNDLLKEYGIGEE